MRRGPGGQDGGGTIQLELFEQHLPERPYCSDNDHGAYVRIRPKQVALRYRYIQAQPPWIRVWLIFDYDQDAAWYAADRAGLPPPTIIVINRKNGHGHLFYAIRVPVRMEIWGGRLGPVRYMVAVEQAMTVRLGADPSYSGFICKNPLHKHWVTVENGHLFTLGELHGWLGDLKEYRRPVRMLGVGRNVETFDHVRNWAYRAIREHWMAGGGPETWREACTGAAVEFTAQHTPPLHRSECEWIGRSVSKWTWERFTPERFAAIQAAHGRGGAAVQERRAERNRHIRELLAAGYTQVLTAKVMGVSTKTVRRVIHNGTKPYQDNSTPVALDERATSLSPALSRRECYPS